MRTLRMFARARQVRGFCVMHSLFNQPEKEPQQSTAGLSESTDDMNKSIHLMQYAIEFQPIGTTTVILTAQKTNLLILTGVLLLVPLLFTTIKFVRNDDDSKNKYFG